MELHTRLTGTTIFKQQLYLTITGCGPRCGLNGLPLTPNSIRILGRVQVQHNQMQ